MESKPLHPENADSPILVKLLGNTMETKPLHPEYLLLVDYQYYTF